MWTNTYIQLSKDNKTNPLDPEALENLALAAYLTGRDTESFQALERAHHGYLDRQETEKAVRCDFWLGLVLMNAGERARSAGCNVHSLRSIRNN